MANIDIVVPTEGADGTKFVLKSWLTPVGAKVGAQDPIAEIETDKVTMEVTAPSAGVMGQHLVAVGTAVEPGMVIGRMVTGEGAASSAPASSSAATQVNSHGGARDIAGAAAQAGLSPAVRRLIAEHKLDPAAIIGTGRDGRVTLADVEAFVANPKAAAPAPKPAAKAPAAPAKPSADKGGSARIPHDTMRLSIAEHMQRSVSTAPHVTAVFEADFSAIIRNRAAQKAQFERDKINLTYTAYFVAACARAMQKVPAINSRWHDEAVEIFDDINIGVGTALGDKGLVVPVIRRVQDLSLREIAECLTDLTNRARTNQLRPADIQGGTFTISNHGVSGSLFASPIIINQPQSAILGVGKLEKRVVVREIAGQDAIVILPMAYVSLTIDHRVLDGHQTNGFLSAWVETIEHWSE